MQTDYLFNGIKGYTTFRRFSYLWTMKTKEADRRYKILQFYDKYGLIIPQQIQTTFSNVAFSKI